MKNSYYVRGRLFPTILTVIPLLIFVNVIVGLLYEDVLKEIYGVLPLITKLGLSGAILFLMVQINRFVAKEVFQRFYFKDENHMPTTNHLIWTDTFLDDIIKEKIRNKIQTKYGLVLMNKLDESTDEDKSRRQIVTAVSQIRISLKENKLLLQHNIEYGFIRNLLGGCLIAIIFSIAILITGTLKEEDALKILGTGLTVIYLVPVLFSNLIIKKYGIYYSKILYEQFLTI